MTDTQMTTQLELHWVPVTGPDGRTHMESRWVSVDAHTRPHVHAA